MPEIHPASAQPGTTVSFRYYGGSTPGVLRIVKITNVSNEYIRGHDMNANGFRQFRLDDVVDMRDDWSCETCNNVVFASKQCCSLCLSRRGDTKKYFPNGEALKPGDWVCPNEDCKNVNFA
jgi:hypothetical protein